MRQYRFQFVGAPRLGFAGWVKITLILLVAVGLLAMALVVGFGVALFVISAFLLARLLRAMLAGKTPRPTHGVVEGEYIVVQRSNVPRRGN